jgi:hypothetical protein
VAANAEQVTEQKNLNKSQNHKNTKWRDNHGATFMWH